MQNFAETWTLWYETLTEEIKPVVAESNAVN